MNWTSRCELARIKMERLNPDHSCIELGIRLQELSKRLRRNILATRNGDVRMPRAKVRLEARSERCLLHSLVNLKQVRMRFADADPDDFRRALCRKRSDPNNRQKKGAELNCTEFFSQGRFSFILDFIEETERQMHLRRIGPAHTANLRVKRRKQFAR